MHEAHKVHWTNGFRMANCFYCLSQNAMVCLAHCRQQLQQKSWKTARVPRLQYFFFKTLRPKCSRPRPRPKLHDPRPRPRFSFLYSRRLETKTLVSSSTSLLYLLSYYLRQWDHVFACACLPVCLSACLSVRTNSCDYWRGEMCDWNRLIKYWMRLGSGCGYRNL